MLIWCILAPSRVKLSKRLNLKRKREKHFADTDMLQRLLVSWRLPSPAATVATPAPSWCDSSPLPVRSLRGIRGKTAPAAALAVSHHTQRNSLPEFLSSRQPHRHIHTSPHTYLVLNCNHLCLPWLLDMKGQPWVCNTTDIFPPRDACAATQTFSCSAF